MKTCAVCCCRLLNIMAEYYCFGSNYSWIGLASASKCWGVCLCWGRLSAVKDFYHVFSLVRRAIVVRCPDLLLLFLFHCRRRTGPPLALLFHFIYTAAAAAASSSASFVAHESSQVTADPFQHSFPVQPAGVCPLLLSPQLRLPSCPTSPTRMSTWRSERRRELIISSHLISFHQILQKLMSYTTQLSDIKQSHVQIPPPNKQKNL